MSSALGHFHYVYLTLGQLRYTAINKNTLFVRHYRYCLMTSQTLAVHFDSLKKFLPKHLNLILGNTNKINFNWRRDECS